MEDEVKKIWHFNINMGEKNKTASWWGPRVPLVFCGGWFQAFSSSPFLFHCDLALCQGPRPVQAFLLAHPHSFVTQLSSRDPTATALGWESRTPQPLYWLGSRRGKSNHRAEHHPKKMRPDIHTKKHFKCPNSRSLDPSATNWLKPSLV